jgi:hypothetical protein
MRVHVRGHVGHMAHEESFLENEVVGGEHHHRRLGVAGTDPVCGEEHAGRGASISGLREDLKRREIRKLGEIRRQVARVARQGHEHRALRRDQQGDTIQGLAQEGLVAGQHGILFRTVFPIQVAGQGSESHPLPAGQHDRPEMSFLGVHGIDGRIAFAMLEL